MVLAWHLQESTDFGLAHHCTSSPETSVWKIVDTQWIFEISHIQQIFVVSEIKSDKNL